jgi:TrbL/VirB6 plasmid conjugal transfer protein
MEKYALFTLLWTNIAVPIDAASAAMVAALMARIGPWFKLCVGAYLLITMLIAAWSNDSEAAQRLFRSLFLAAVVYTIAFNAGTFDYYVTQLVHGTTNAISTATANMFPGGAGPINSNAFDIVGTRSFAIGLAVFKNLPMNPLKSVPLGMCIVVYWWVSYWAIVVMFSVYLVSYVLGAFIMAFGPLFIPLYFFPFTRKYFDGWLSCVLCTLLVQVFTAALAAMFVFVIGMILTLAATGLAGNQLATVDGGVIIGELMMLIITALVCCIFAILAGVLVYVAVRITGGAHSELGKMQAPAWMPSFGGGGNNPPPPPPPPPHGGGNHHGGAGGGVPPGPGTAGHPPRDHAFTRNVSPPP